MSNAPQQEMPAVALEACCGRVGRCCNPLWLRSAAANGSRYRTYSTRRIV
jgi:hypothetical protein